MPRPTTDDYEKRNKKAHALLDAALGLKIALACHDDRQAAGYLTRVRSAFAVMEKELSCE